MAFGIQSNPSPSVNPEQLSSAFKLETCSRTSYPRGCITQRRIPPTFICPGHYFPESLPHVHQIPTGSCNSILAREKGFSVRNADVMPGINDSYCHYGNVCQTEWAGSAGFSHMHRHLRQTSFQTYSLSAF